MQNNIWVKCLELLQNEISQQDFNTWIAPLQAKFEGNILILLAPNRFVLNWVQENFYLKIKQLITNIDLNNNFNILLKIGDNADNLPVDNFVDKVIDRRGDKLAQLQYGNQLNTTFTFVNFVEGKSNEFAAAAAAQVAIKPGTAYNPLLIYGDVGLGKTHLMHAVGNEMLDRNKNAKVLYLHSEKFVANMIKALQTNTIDNFKRYYREVDALLIDDIQFFAGKDRSQEEFFHTFNYLLEEKKQIILTCDRYPKEIQGLKERLQSRFGWGLTVAIEPPELETRVAILIKKAENLNFNLPYDVAFFIAKRIRSNVRELEGALKRVIANSDFTGQSVTVEFVKDTLRDLINIQNQLVSINNIQRTIAEYYKIKISDLLSQRRIRSITRPRQMAMFFSKELTDHSLPEIGKAFGGRDHTTVIHGCQKIKELLKTDKELKEDYTNLAKVLSN